MLSNRRTKYVRILVANGLTSSVASSLSDMSDTPAPSARDKLLDPKKLVADLDEYIIGQDRAKRSLAVAMVQHQARTQANLLKTDIQLDPQSILILGPTGCGKTAMLKALGKIVSRPVTIYDVSGITSSGYIGSNIEDIFTAITNTVKSNSDGYLTKEAITKKAESSIVYLDEIDKLRRRPGVSKDFGESVQFELLKIIESNIGADARYPYDSKHMMFVCGGAFSGLEDIIKSRLTKKASGIGFVTELGDKEPDEESLFSKVLPKDLIEYGMVPELIGRFSHILVLNHLNEVDLIKILKEPKNSILQQHGDLFDQMGIQLTWSDKALAQIAKHALKHKTGARALKRLVNMMLDDLYFNIKEHEEKTSVTITEKMVKTRLEDE
jgi:ATP-dependent Clp protease ATP-binding subunit ClpX